MPWPARPAASAQRGLAAWGGVRRSACVQPAPGWAALLLLPLFQSSESADLELLPPLLLSPPPLRATFAVPAMVKTALRALPQRLCSGPACSPFCGLHRAGAAAPAAQRTSVYAPAQPSKFQACKVMPAIVPCSATLCRPSAHGPFAPAELHHQPPTPLQPPSFSPSSPGSRVGPAQQPSEPCHPGGSLHSRGSAAPQATRPQQPKHSQ